MHEGMSGETETFIHTYTTLKFKKNFSTQKVMNKQQKALM